MQRQPGEQTCIRNWRENMNIINSSVVEALFLHCWSVPISKERKGQMSFIWLCDSWKKGFECVCTCTFVTKQSIQHNPTMCLDNLKFENKNKNLFYTENIKNLSEHIFLKKKKKNQVTLRKKKLERLEIMRKFVTNCESLLRVIPKRLELFPLHLFRLCCI